MSAVSGGVRELSGVEPLYMIGESHCITFGDRLFDHPASGLRFHCRSRFLPHLQADNFSRGAEAVLHDDLLGALLAEHLISSQGQPMHLASHELAVSAAYLSGRSQGAPAIVLFAGDMALHRLLQQMGGQVDFLLDEDPGYGADRGKNPLPVAALTSALDQLFLPFLRGIDRLRAAGFVRLMVHCLPPRTADDALAARWLSGVSISAAVRAKLTLLANRRLAEACAGRDIGFIDTWPALTAGGYLRPEFGLDGVHLARHAAAVTIGQVAASLTTRRRGIGNPVRYRMLLAQTSEGVTESPPVATGRTAVQFAMASLAPLAGEPDASPQRSSCQDPEACGMPDWLGDAVDPGEGAIWFDPSPGQLTAAFERFGADDFQTAMSSLSGRSMNVCGYRLVRLDRVDANVSLNRMSPPEGCCRGLLLLSGSGELRFGNPTGHEALRLLAAGQFILLDASAAHCRLRAQSGPVIVALLHLMPRLPDQPFRLIASRLNDWPVDPFCHTLAGMSVLPPAGEVYCQRALPVDGRAGAVPSVQARPGAGEAGRVS